jgi:hypothetical protein
MTDKDLHPAGITGNLAAGLDDLLAASDQRLLAAIRRRLDPAPGLRTILGDSGLRWQQGAAAAGGGPRLAGPPGADGTMRLTRQLLGGPRPGEAGARIASLRFALLDLSAAAGRGRRPDTAAVLIGAAAANLKDLNRGLEDGELTCCGAIALLDQVDLALATARDSQWPAALPWREACQQADAGRIRKPRAWLLRWLVSAPTSPALLVVVIPMLIAAFAAAAVPLWAARWLSAGFLAGTLVIPLVSVVAFLITLAAGWAIAGRTLRRRVDEPAGRDGGPRGTAEISDLRAELSQLRPAVVRLFDAVDRCPAHA